MAALRKNFYVERSAFTAITITFKERKMNTKYSLIGDSKMIKLFSFIVVVAYMLIWAFCPCYGENNVYTIANYPLDQIDYPSGVGKN